MSGFFGPEEQKALDKQRDRHGYEPPELSSDELVAIEERKKFIDALFSSGTDIKATYKLELNFGKERSRNVPFPGALTIFRSGTAFHGGGDEIVYPCPQDACPGIIPPELISETKVRAICPKCERMYHRDALQETRLFRLHAQKWATIITRYFIRLNHDADIYVKTHLACLHTHTTAEQSRDRGGEMLGRARGNRRRVIYPLEHIYKDLSAGAEIEKRFHAFILA